MKRIAAILTSLVLVFSLAACGSKGDGKGDAQGATAEEIYAQIQELADKENAIMEENLELWQKLFAAMNEKRDEIPDESNYGAYLLAALDLVKDQFTEDELKTLTEGSEQIRDLEDQIQPLQEQYAALQPAGDGENGDMNDAVPTFPTFTGKDLDGNDVDSSIFSQNAVTLQALRGGAWRSERPQRDAQEAGRRAHRHQRRYPRWQRRCDQHGQESA